jgi:hypothetical protein
MDSLSLLGSSPSSVLSPLALQAQRDAVGLDEFIEQLPLAIQQRKSDKEKGACNSDPVIDLLE